MLAPLSAVQVDAAVPDNVYPLSQVNTHVVSRAPVSAQLVLTPAARPVGAAHVDAAHTVEAIHMLTTKHQLASTAFHHCTKNNMHDNISRKTMSNECPFRCCGGRRPLGIKYLCKFPSALDRMRSLLRYQRYMSMQQCRKMYTHRRN